MNELFLVSNSERPLKRRLAALAFLDVAGYSRLMGRGEETTLMAWSTLRNSVIEPRIGAWRGRVVDRAGDGIFAEFGSALDALRWAIEVQDVTSRHRDVGEPLRLRIALHLADVIDGPAGEVYGDGVNITARLQNHAELGGVIISRALVDAVLGKTNAVFVDLGPVRLNNIAQPVHAFRLQAASASAPVAPAWTTVVRIISILAGVFFGFALFWYSPVASWRSTPREQAEHLLRQGLAVGCPAFPCAREWLASRALYERAIAIDPTFARAYAEAAFTYTNLVANHLSNDAPADLHAAALLATRAVALAPDQAASYEARGAVLRQNPDQLEYALTAYLRALAIDPHRISARANAGWILVLLGRPAEAEPYLQAALAMAPHDSNVPFWLHRLGLAELFLGRYDNAADLFRRAIDSQPEHAITGDTGLERAIDLAAALALDGKVDAARLVIDGVRRQYPALSTQNLWDCACSHAPGFQAGLARLRQGAVQAGVPDID